MRFTDSDALAFLQSQLSYIQPQVFERKYGAIIYPELMPVTSEAGEWAESVTTHYMDGFVAGQFIGAAGDDIPFANVGMSRDVIPVRQAAIGFEYTTDELRTSKALGRDLSILKMDRARRGYEEHAQQVAFFGDADRGLEGLFNHSAVATGGAAGPFDGASDGDAAAAIFNEAIDHIIETTKEIEIPDVVLLPTTAFNYLATTRLDITGAAMSILEYCRQYNNSTSRTGRPLDIRSNPWLESADKMVV